MARRKGKDSNIGRMIVERYEIKAKLGEGGMASVYRAHDHRARRDVALKLLPHALLHDDTFRRRFDLEATAVASLEHPAIVPLYDYGEDRGQPYLVMRLMAGGSLWDRIKEGPIPDFDVVRIVSQIAPGLDKAHQRNFIHRDMKPANVLFDEESNAYISDFGIVKSDENTMQLTGEGIIGTPAYLAPEMAQPGGLNPSVDLYAVGVMIFEMMTGELPFEGDSAISMIMAHVSASIPDITTYRPDVPLSVKQVLDRALAKLPGDRYPTGQVLARALEEGFGRDWLSSEAARQPPSVLPRPSSGPSPRTVAPEPPQPQTTPEQHPTLPDHQETIDAPTEEWQQGWGEPPAPQPVDDSWEDAGTATMDGAPGETVEGQGPPPERVDDSPTADDMQVTMPVESPSAEDMMETIPDAITPPRERPMPPPPEAVAAQMQRTQPVAVPPAVDQPAEDIAAPPAPQVSGAGRGLPLPLIGGGVAVLLIAGVVALVLAGGGAADTPAATAAPTEAANSAATISATETLPPTETPVPSTPTITPIPTSPEALARLIGHREPITGVTVNPAALIAASVGADGLLNVWDATDDPSFDLSAPSLTLSLEDGFAHGLEFSPDGTQIALVGPGQQVTLIDPETGVPSRLPQFTPVTSLAWSPEGDELVIGGENGAVYVQAPFAGAGRYALTTAHEAPVTAVDFNSLTEVDVVVSGDESGHVVVWDYVRNEVLAEFDVEGAVTGVAFGSEGINVIVSAGEAVHLWTAELGILISSETTPEIAEQGGSFLAVTVSPDGDRVAAASSVGLVAEWDLSFNFLENPRTYMGHVGPVTDVVYAGDSDLLVSGGEDGTLIVFDVGE